MTGKRKNYFTNSENFSKNLCASSLHVAFHKKTSRDKAHEVWIGYKFQKVND
ncbi:hypothetical protein SAMN05216167_12631 [Spirosoma endophyticum]|uniref:Uncharacterized protein n=1 Tax=Spirosoma endophyticum TaxID=662367 RepID=A0A1I2FL78_9BACT|nr:hypothetical protein SAMN05216167_12631 [Spirosoma endophyticum]